MFWLKCEKPSSGEIKIPNKYNFVIDIKPLFMSVCVYVFIYIYIYLRSQVSTFHKVNHVH